MEKFRCINDKTGEVKYLSPSVANNAQFMRKYGWRIEQVEKAAPQETKRAVVEDPIGADFDTSSMNFFEDDQPERKAPEKVAPAKVSRAKGGSKK
jgi:hypothetical protein